MHCLILRGERQVVVRCWAQDTLLNGQQFVDAVVSPGDCLQVGKAMIRGRGLECRRRRRHDRKVAGNL